MPSKAHGVTYSGDGGLREKTQKITYLRKKVS